MVQTRRSLSKSPAPPAASQDSSNDNNTSETPRSRRRQTRSVLRSQSTGVGISIDTDAKVPTAKKIVFDEEGNLPPEHEIALVPEIKPELNPTRSDDDDDDDAVEEVKGSDAKSQMQEQRIAERSTARESTVIRGGQKRKRKQKNVEEKKEELDDDFFEQLDAEIEKEKKESKQQKEDCSTGKLITFVAKDDALQNRMPVKKDHNIQIVVLNDDKQVRSGPPVPLVSTGSSSAYSRFQVNNGMDEPSAKQLQKAKKTGRKVEETWTRSNKVTQKLLGGRRGVQEAEKLKPEQASRTVVIRL